MRKRLPSPPVPIEPVGHNADSEAAALLAHDLAKHDMEKAKKRPTVLTAPEEWDFSAIPPNELPACLCYELARESETIVRLSEAYLERWRSGSDDITATHTAIVEKHIKCGFLLESLAPHFDLRKTTWEKLDVEARAAAAKAFRGRSAFGTAKPGDVGSYKSAMKGSYSNLVVFNERGETTVRKYARGVKEWDGVNLHFQTGDEITLVHIDWT